MTTTIRTYTVHRAGEWGKLWSSLADALHGGVINVRRRVPVSARDVNRSSLQQIVARPLADKHELSRKGESPRPVTASIEGVPLAPHGLVKRARGTHTSHVPRDE